MKKNIQVRYALAKQVFILCSCNHTETQIISMAGLDSLNHKIQSLTDSLNQLEINK